MTDYVWLLQRAWQIVFRHKVLLVFGLVAMLAGQDALFNLRGAIRLQPLTEAIVNLPLPIANAVRALVRDDSGVIMVVVMIVVGLICLVPGVIASAALIALTQATERGGEASLKLGLQLALPHVPTLVGIRLIFNVPIALLSLAGILFAGRLFDTANGQVGFTQVLQAAGLLPIFLIAGLVIGSLIGAIGVGADRACVLNGLGVVAALRRGWELFRRYLSRYVAVTGVFISTSLLIVFTLACPLAMLLADQLAAIAQAAPSGTDLTPMLLSTPSGSMIGLGLLLLYGFFTAFASVVWTLVYRRFD